ncbi:ubiquinone/menaquinone biosynthesis C-methylase UbiE [Salirhabdus euzebyi]|uniref:Ubiquinone/menaquinone biosynthesis C-methylase UbiE n=1 Tax=Salirhabdus euzebyi TaxID=394506 RepID=A0A841Q6R1_9BACI|nr:class I SAM-dependent methyltransferase [Salirhabdus euzebyi]MBB6454096.1 ubiquinone/menaquinone biosynthesis C-methylase UbiE [Salirhabdus euzebyi]
MGNKFDWHKETEKQWDQRASYWNENSDNMWDKGSRKTIIPFLARFVPKGSQVGDIGCGDGYGSWKLHREGYKVIGVDISKQMIEKAKARTVPEQLMFEQGDLAELPFQSESFDAIMAINSLEWVEDPLHALRELSRVLRKHGVLCVGILGPTAHPRINSFPRLYGENAICNTMMPWEFKKLVEEMGFELLDGHGVYKREVKENTIASYPEELKQALSFMWVYAMKKNF